MKRKNEDTLDLNKLYESVPVGQSKEEGHVFKVMDFFSLSSPFVHGPPYVEERCSSVTVRWDFPKSFGIPACGLVIFTTSFMYCGRGEALTFGLLCDYSSRGVFRSSSYLSDFLASLFLSSRIEHGVETGNLPYELQDSEKREETDVLMLVEKQDNCLYFAGADFLPYNPCSIFLTEWRDDLIASTDRCIVDPYTKVLSGGAFPEKFFQNFFYGTNTSPCFSRLWSYPILEFSTRPELFLSSDDAWKPIINAQPSNILKQFLFSADIRTKKSLLHLNVEKNIAKFYKKHGFVKKRSVKQKKDPVEVLEIKTI
jgi:hypothetical protein